MLMLLGAGCVAAPQPIEPQEAIVTESATVVDATMDAELTQEQDVVVNEENALSVQVIDEVTLELPVTPTMPTEEDIVVAPAPAIVSVSVQASQFTFSPSTITVNKGDTVRMTVTSADVNHGLSIPAFGVSKSIDAGATVTVEFVADKTGEFPFFCSVFCGEGHGQMRGTLIVKE